MPSAFRTAALFVLLVSMARVASAAPATAPSAVGVPVAYQLPTDGPLPQTYRVTLAIVDAKNPDWIVSQFAAGVARTVTAENGGRFAETWDGLDDNFMPVPPGDYAVRGIYMAAKKWAVDGEFHSVTPRFVTGASPWLPTPDQANKPEPFGGDPTGAPFGDVAVGPNGMAVFYYTYLENGTNNPMLDLSKPDGPEQFVRAYNSGGAGGGTSTATDGFTVWSYSTDGGPKFVYRADQKPFGTGRGANRNNVFRPDGWVTAMAAWRDDAAERSFVYVAQRGKIIEPRKDHFGESDAEFIDKLTVLAGEDGKVLAELPIRRPRGLAVHGSQLFVLHEEAGGFVVSTVDLEGGLPKGEWEQRFAVPQNIVPADFEVDGRSRMYFSDPAANHVYQFEANGTPRLTFGRLDAQRPGAYDPHSLITPGKLATWTDAQGADRLLIVEDGGPNRVAEWSADTRKLIREFPTLQTRANDGYAIDPANPNHIYLPGQKNWLTRFVVDIPSRAWKVDAVWPNVGNDPKLRGLDRPKFITRDGRNYLASGKDYAIYRQAGDRWLLSAGIVRETVGKERAAYFWSDANSDGKVQEEEYRNRPTKIPPGVLRYHGENWLDDLSMVSPGQGGKDVWRLAPNHFDDHGNPVFADWQKLLTDPVFEARAAGKADAVHGGNELADSYNSDWAEVDGTLADGFYVSARGGHSFSANEGAQFKLTRYVPDGKGGYRLKWRTGRSALDSVADAGEAYGPIHMNRPINGLVSVIDQSRCGVLLYTEDGLYVDTLFPDQRRHRKSDTGLYALPGEFFAGTVFANKETGKIHVGVGKYTPMLYETEGWSLKENPARALTTVQKTVSIGASQVASPPEIAMSVRGGAGAAKIARFAPAIGGATLDGSLAGWESCEPIRFGPSKEQNAEVRCLYDPEHLYLRWHARLGGKFEAKPLPAPERIFTHDRGADTLSFYVQGDPSARAGGPAGGRPGDVRIVFGLNKEGDALKPIAVGMYPTAPAGAKATAQTYATPVGKATFEHVGPLSDVKLTAKVDEDGKGFVLVAAIPRALIPQAAPFAGGFRTMANFEATFGGHNKFWWANSDGSASRETYDEPTEARLYPGSWAPAQFQGLDQGVVVRNWQILGPFGGPGAEAYSEDVSGGLKDAATKFANAAKYPPDDGKVDLGATFTGPQVQGYWRDPGTVRWRPAVVDDLDTRVRLGPSAQTYYGATWLHAPADTELEFQFQGHPQTPIQFYLSGELVQSGEIKDEKGSKHPDRRVARKALTLKKGWNQVTFRGFCVGYPPARAGLVLAGPEEKLWTIKLSPTPPGE